MTLEIEPARGHLVTFCCQKVTYTTLCHVVHPLFFMSLSGLTFFFMSLSGLTGVSRSKQISHIINLVSPIKPENDNNRKHHGIMLPKHPKKLTQN